MSRKDKICIFIKYFFVGTAVCLVMIGRVATIDLTEGRALIEGIWYWVGSIVALVVGVVIELVIKK